MIKLIIFDVDGTLTDSKQDHFNTLNHALKEYDEKYCITEEEQRDIYEGLPTKEKLKLLTKYKNLPLESHNQIWKRKQELGQELIQEYKPDNRLIEIFQELKNRKYMIYVASNCTWKNTMLILTKKGFMEYIDWFITNEDVDNPKPSPEMYLKCIIRSGLKKDEILIVEDSEIGIEAAKESGCNVVRVDNPMDITLTSQEIYLKNHLLM